MAEAPTIQWTGESGNTYKYWIHPIGAPFKDAAGNYIFAKETEANRWRPIYIGQTGSLRDRLTSHEKEECARKNGATHIHAHTNDKGEQARLDEETDLVRKWNPACNG